jgi:N-dimethylarginine dimethylaminohydrolase
MVHTSLATGLPALEGLPVIPRPGRVLLTTPHHYQVEYLINPHMAGNVGSVDEHGARLQWEGLRSAYESLGFQVSVVEGVAGLPDMVFCANQTLPFRTPAGEHGVVIGRMHAPERKPEVDHYAAFFQAEGYRVEHLDPELPGDFEGMGDAIWHPERYLLWGGYGFRTDRAVYERFHARLGFPVVAVELVDPYFYHLDTCFCPLDSSTVLIYPGAFTEDGRSLIRHYFERVVEAPENEARSLLACNAHCPDGRNVIIQAGCAVTNALLRREGFAPIEVDTSEFLKAGGSVFCMKLMFW